MKLSQAAAAGLAAAVPVVAVAVLGGLATAPAIPAWYAGLAKPPGTPPNSVFGPVWTLLYAAMIVASWRLLVLPKDSPGRMSALSLHVVQLALNGAWSWAFFGARSPALGLVVILALIVAIALAIRAFRAVDGVAALLMVPYLAWVAYATYLNAGVWWLNR